MKFRLSFWILSIFCCFSLITTTSCKKKGDKPADLPPAVHTIDTNILAYIQIPVSRHFVYLNSATGLLDSVDVSLSLLEQKYQPPVNFVNDFGISYTVPGYYYQTYILQLFKTNNIPSSWLYAKDGDENGFHDENNVTIFEYTDNKSSDLYVGDTTVEGNNYSEVLVEKAHSLLPEDDPNYVSEENYWAKNIGIIERYLKTKTSEVTYTLIKYY